ncbi:8839_t:CDS:2 [Funneliformis geosporum]|nr:8839_t:CDS:2 [Funneliformis geosporum]
MTDIKLKIKDILRFNGNIYTVQAEESINLEERGAVNSVNFTYDGNLNIGETITIHGIDLNDLENSRITANNGISNWDIGRFTRITVNREVTNNQEQTQVLGDENIPLDQSTLYLSNESFENAVFPAIREYIRNHPGEFRLGEGKHENFLPGTVRPWWSPEIPEEEIGTSPWQDCQPAGEIYPSRPRTQYEELKRLIPNTCQFPEDELEAEKDNDEREKVSPEEGKKMSDKPEQPVSAEVFSHQKNQLLAQEKELAYQKIAQLLKKYNLETENLPPEWQN